MNMVAAGLSPFDLLAPEYDASFTESLLGRLLRDAVHRELQASFAAGHHVLDLGCGTGEDAISLAAGGVRVHGVDGSGAMIARSRGKASQLREAHAPTFEVVDLNAHALPAGPFDGALANFGVLNCIRDRQAFAARLAAVLRPEARVVFVVMGRYCPWEWAWYLLRGKPRTAFRRLSGKADFHGMRIDYPTPSELSRHFEPAFGMRRTAGIGFLLPPTFATDLIERNARFGRVLDAVDRRICGWPGVAMLSDHYLIEMERI